MEAKRVRASVIWFYACLVAVSVLLEGKLGHLKSFFWAAGDLLITESRSSIRTWSYALIAARKSIM